jgi:hypothetical protein
MLNQFLYNSIEPIEWRQTVYNNTPLSIFYRSSPFFYSLVGICVIVFYKRLREYDKTFTWIPFGFALFLQGFISYMGDVYTWGMVSNWKNLDTIYAAFLTFVSGPIMIIRAFMGYANYPTSLPFLWGIFVIWAIVCKFMSTRVLRLNLNVDEYLLWHGLWHCLPVYATAIILWLGIRKI